MKKSKKILAAMLSATLTLSMCSMPALAAATGSGSKTDSLLKKTSAEQEFDGTFFSVSGFADGKVNARAQYKEGDNEYRVVNNEVEFLKALKNAQSGDVKVIELRADMCLGWWELSSEAKAAGSGIVSEYNDIDDARYTPYTNPTLVEAGLSNLRLTNIDGLTVFSQSGNIIKHTQFQLQNSVNDFVMRNISVDEVWEWDDFRGQGFGESGGKGNHKRVGWSPVKINGAKNIWFDHCSFGLGFDGCVDLENGAEGVSLTWCRIGDTDTSLGSMIYKTAMYMEQIYQESLALGNPKWSFTGYRIMRENGMTVEQIMEYMAYHSKVHLCGAGDKDTWLVEDVDEEENLIYDYSDNMTYTNEAFGLDKNGNVDYHNLTSDLKDWIKKNNITDGSKFPTVVTHPDFEKTDANELIELSLGYNQYWNVGQRVPMIRGGSGHLYNCYINDSGTQNIDAIINKKDSSGSSISDKFKEAGSDLGKLQRTLDARNGASIAADTCVWQNVSQPVPGSQYQKNDISNMNSPYHQYFTNNYAIIVNSKVQTASDKAAYVGNSFDNDGKNDFMNAYKWFTKPFEFSWHNLAQKNAYRAKGTTDEAVALRDYDKLTYEYKTMPLDKVEEITNKYSGFKKVKMSASDWLKTDYNSDFVVETLSDSDLVEAAQVKLSKSEATVYMAESEYLQLDASIIPSNSNKKAADLTWTSSDENVAKVSNCGLVVPVGYGKATIKAALSDKLYAECVVNVSTSPSKIEVTNVPSTIYTGDIFTLEAKLLPEGDYDKTVIWTKLSSNLETLDKTKGEFQAVKSGRKLSVNVMSMFNANRVGYKHKDASYNQINVVDPEVAVTGITFDKSALSEPIKVNESVQINASVVPSDATNKNIYWSSSDESVAKVDSTGKVTAIKAGKAVIEAKTMNYGFVSTCEAVVEAESVVEPTESPVETTAPPTQTTAPPVGTTEPPIQSTTPPIVTEYDLGDVNKDTNIDLDDVMIILRAALGIEELDEEETLLADIDKDKTVSLSDCLAVLKIALGIE